MEASRLECAIGGACRTWVRMLNYYGMRNQINVTKTFLKNEKVWVAPTFFRGHQDPPKYFIKEAKSFMSNKLVGQL